MTNILYFEGRREIRESKKKMTHVLLGRRNERLDSPGAMMDVETHRLSYEEQQRVLAHAVRKIGQGMYENHVLGWYASEADAEAAKP